MFYGLEIINKNMTCLLGIARDKWQLVGWECSKIIMTRVKMEVQEVLIWKRSISVVGRLPTTWVERVRFPAGAPNRRPYRVECTVLERST